ncbi:MAG: BlaI/MecI/CopY family transcriptional regulator [Tissierellia bacterium]|nr:BlaI/MecI/CopY family transcriptional regulator [Tissierellia bacterium]
MKNIEFSPNEKQILDTLWREGRPLSRSEIIELTPNKTWKDSSIHILLNQLMDKKAIEVEGFTRTGKTYGRTYQPLLKKADFDIIQLEKDYFNVSPNRESLNQFLSSLFKQGEIDADHIKNLNKLLKEKEGN